jgi:hypothetical protein
MTTAEPDLPDEPLERHPHPGEMPSDTDVQAERQEEGVRAEEAEEAVEEERRRRRSRGATTPEPARTAADPDTDQEPTGREQADRNRAEDPPA